MASLKDKVQLQFLKEVPDSIYNMKNFEKLCRAVNNMDHELCNFRDDIVEYFKKGFDNLTNEDRDICSCLLSQYVDLDEAYQIALDFKATKEALLKEVKH